MARHIYLRVSSQQQSFEQQKHCIDLYFAAEGINPENIDSIVVEKVSGTVNHTDRKLAELIDRCESGDIIYISELSRLGRSMSDIFSIVSKCSNKGREDAEREAERIKKKTGETVNIPYGITIVQCKDKTRIENNSIGGKAILMALSLAAELEVANIRQRTKMGLEVRKQLLRENGSFVSKSGRVCTKLGKPNAEDTRLISQASAKARMDRAVEWREQSLGYNMAKVWYYQGRERKTIINDFNLSHQRDPANWSTPGGKPLTRAILCKWVAEWGEFIPTKI